MEGENAVMIPDEWVDKNTSHSTSGHPHIEGA